MSSCPGIGASPTSETVRQLDGTRATLPRSSPDANPSNVGFTEVCVVARQPGALPKPVIDVWTGQIEEFDLCQLPDRLGRVVVWDDVRGDRALSLDIAGIVLAIEQYFGIKANLDTNATAHLGHFSGPLLSNDKLLHFPTPSDLEAIERRIAVIDLSSGGLARLRWLDVIPSLRRHYTHVIGVDKCVLDFRERDAAFKPPDGLSDLALQTLQACDYWLLARDASIFRRLEPSAEEKSFEFTKLIQDLCDCIALANDIETATGLIAKMQFATFGARA
jgi:hypothetical protein